MQLKRVNLLLNLLGAVSYKRWAFLLLQGVLCAACTSTSMDVHQKLDGSNEYKKFLIFAAAQNPSVEEVVENRVVEVFQRSDIEAIAKYTLIPWPQHIDRLQFQELMEDGQIDAIIILRPFEEVQNLPEKIDGLFLSAFDLYNREATYLYKAADNWSLRDRDIYVQVIDVKAQRISWRGLMTTKTWTTTEIALYRDSLSAAATDMASSIIRNFR